jgi:threonine dehydrogenase-like Zn-dependent dehydrogenase
MEAQAVSIADKQRAALVPIDVPDSPGPDGVRGRTVVSLVSPGTEVNWNYRGAWDIKYPNYPGYAAVFEAEDIGAEVRGIAPGARLFCMGKHQSIQHSKAREAVVVPEGVAAEHAVVARLMGVSMTTLMTTRARPGDIVVVTGMGPVGYLCAHLFAISGYEVLAVEPNEARRRIAERSGLRGVYPDVPLEDAAVKGNVALVVECSGHEGAALDAARIVRKGGEVVLVGVPWKRRTDLPAHDLLDVVFRNYVTLRSGWEWELPRHASDFRPHSNFGCFSLALRWLAERRIPLLQSLIAVHRPEDAQEVYRSLLRKNTAELFHIFDWSGATGGRALSANG